MYIGIVAVSKAIQYYLHCLLKLCLLVSADYVRTYKVFFTLFSCIPTLLSLFPILCCLSLPFSTSNSISCSILSLLFSPNPPSFLLYLLLSSFLPTLLLENTFNFLPHLFLPAVSSEKQLLSCLLCFQKVSLSFL